MQNGPIPTATPDPLSVDTAFVVHLTATEAGPERACGRVEHITSGQSTRFASAAELLTFMRQIITSMVLLMALAIPAWSDDTCLTGSDPEVQGDAAAIGAVRGGIDTTCPCASFDGTTGHTHRDYLRCVKRELDDALDAGDLRAECKSRIKRAFRQSTCGRKPHLQAAPCIHTTTGGEIRCAVRPAAACQSKPGGYARVACPDSVTCVDAGDGNADYLIDRLDSGACVPTPSPTPTATPIDTATATPIDTATATPTATPTVTATVCTASGPIVPRIDVNKDDDPQIVVLPPDPAANQCDPQTLLGGGCEINGLDGTIPNTFDAGATIDGARCPGDSPPSFRWEIFRPPGLGGTPYSAAGIIGYYGPLLTILPNSFPSLEATEAAGDPNWRVLLSIQSNVFPFHLTQKWFKFEFTSSSLTLQMSADCQRIGHIQGEECTIEASNGLPSTEVPPLEPGWTVCASEGGTCSFSGPRTVRYGAYAPYALLNVNGPISCTTAAFGSDPAPDQAKHCEYYGAP